MSFLEILLISFGVSIDAFAVSASGALCPSRIPRHRCAFNAALFFGSFQFFMPVIGFFAASLMAELVAACDHYIAFGLLAFVGGRMVWEGLRSGNGGDAPKCPLKGDFFACRRLFLPAVATSMDALAVGAGFAFAGQPLWLPAAAMGIVTALVSACGVLLGSRLGKLARSEKALTIAGGIAIILIGLKILLTDLGVF